MKPLAPVISTGAGESAARIADLLALRRVDGKHGLMARLLVLATALLAACGADEKRLESLLAPDGFVIEVYAEVPGARQLALGPGGTLFVGTRGDALYAVRDEDGDGRSERVVTLAEGLNRPNGVVVRDGALYVGEIHRVIRYDDIEARLEDPPTPLVLVDDYPTEEAHGLKYLAFGPDGWLYVPVGVPCNICEPTAPIYGTITRVRADGTGREIYASGIRNSVGFDWHPDTGELWFTDNGRDQLGDDLPPDELNRVRQAGLHFGYPYCHGGDLPDPEFGSKRPCAETEPPAQRLGPHVASLGMRFYTGAAFPPEYQGQIFIAEHGSWNRSVPIGYRVTRVRLDAAGDPVEYAPFITGWLDEASGDAWGRPVDVLQTPEGDLFVSDDKAGQIYRVRYVP
ncbi:MAG: PQQ-dependent sugar dehydrogenase [Myxococcales bacterium]|nr:PQQ-dependent sugar dehydrogenase [Myxococcales bacterium]